MHEKAIWIELEDHSRLADSETKSLSFLNGTSSQINSIGTMRVTFGSFVI